jgi:glutathione S-transferase
MLKIYGRKSAFNVQKVMWLVQELGLVHEHVPLGGQFGGLNTPEFLAKNPCGHIPVIEDNGAIVWESHTILRYLAASYGPQFWPDSALARSLSDRWMDWAQSSLQPDFLKGVFWAFYRTPEAQRDEQAIQKSLLRCCEHFLLLDKVLAGKKYLGGDEFSLADIPAGTNLYRYFTLEISRPKLPNVEKWYARLQERPAYRENVMIPYAEMKGRLDY